MISRLVLLYGLAYFYSIHFAPYLASTAPDSVLNQAHERCYANVHPSWRRLLSGRGSQYIIGDDAKSASLDDCLVTFWGGSHAFLYLLIGYFCPSTFWPTFWIGAAFEIYELYAYDCADPLDLIWNSIGFLVGASIRKRMSSTK